jgi:hypothetical protein
VTRPAVRPPQVGPDVRRRGAVYGIPTLPVDADGRIVPGPPVVGYVGQTRQTVKQREGQHRDDKPFGDLIVGGSWVIEEGVWSDDELDARERYYIRHGVTLIPGQRAQRPVYNYTENLDNSARVEIWRQVEQRQVREPGWTPPEKGAWVPRQRSRPEVVSAPFGGFEWTRRRVKVACWAVGWLAVAVLVAVWVAGLPTPTAGDGAAYGCGVATVLVGVLLPGRKRRRGRRR